MCKFKRELTKLCLLTNRTEPARVMPNDEGAPLGRQPSVHPAQRRAAKVRIRQATMTSQIIQARLKA